MSSDKKNQKWNRIPIRFVDAETDDDVPEEATGGDSVIETAGLVDEEMTRDEESMQAEEESDPGFSVPAADDYEEAYVTSVPDAGGPVTAELVATRAELKRVESEVNELKDRLARRQADFENYRKRNDRERTDTYNRVVTDVAGKLLPVLDNLRRALDAEANVESGESDEFRHFLSGVDLIYKQLDGVIEALGVKPIPSVGEQFNPHIHEAVVTEPTDEFEPDTIVQEIVRGYRMGDKLVRPALVKVAVKK
jgi:molecular chaperone GrpE